MTVKRFRAPTIEDAMAKAKAAFGGRAQVLEARRVAPRGPLGFLRRSVYEVVVGVGRENGPPAVDPRSTVAAAARSLDSGAGGGSPEGRGEAHASLPPASSILATASSGAELEDRLIEQGLGRQRAAALVEECRRRAANSGRGRPTDHLRTVLGERLRTTGEAHPPASGETSVVALIGPPGSGKTTTVVKLAARFALARAQKVALASVDFFRVGAVEQLKAYAEVLGVPFHLCPGPEDVPRVLEAARAATWLLVDTPGLASNDAARRAELGTWLAAFPAAQRHLVINAAADREAALGAVESYRPLGYGQLVFAQLDEARRHGPILAAADAAGVPVSYLGVGQDVARDLEVATTDRLVRLILGRT